MQATSPGADPAGFIRIHLTRTPEGLSCAIASHRPVQTGRAFAGRPPAEVARWLPRLFSVCARAQANACVQALEGAAGLTPPAAVTARRAIAVDAEAVREHLWRILLDWPRRRADPPAALVRILARSRALQTALDPDGALFQPGAWRSGPGVAPPAALAEPGEWVTQQVLGMPPAQWLEEVNTPNALACWAARGMTDPARIVRELIAADAGSWGLTPVDPLPELPDAVLLDRLGGRDGLDFAERPDWDGRPYETTPLTRQSSQPLIRALGTDGAAGLLARLAAQLTDLACLARRIQSAPVFEPAPERALDWPAGTGLGRAEAARGRLIHLAGVTAEQVTEYRILAPTAWNFHPRGVLNRALTSLPDSDDARLRRQAEWLILAIDPCVGFELMVTSGSRGRL